MTGFEDLLGRCPSLPSGTRAGLNRWIFRGMLFACGPTAVALHLLSRDLAWDFAKASARALALATGVEIEVRGLENFPEGPAVVTPNHASHFDIPALLGFLPGEAHFAAKKELFDEPILGWVMRTLGMVPVDRENPVHAIDDLQEVVGRAGATLIVFPEGTRSRDGNLGKFKKGAFRLAIARGLPVVPIAVHGSKAVMRQGGYLAIEPGRIVIEILPAFETTGLTADDRHELTEQVRDAILRRLLAGGDARPAVA